MNELDPLDGGVECIGRLADAGLRLVTLTNGSADSTRTLLERAGIAERFEVLVSCDEVEVSKPHPRTYELARRATGDDAWLVASHAGDVQGAGRAGFNTLWVGRPETRYLDVFPQPNVRAPNIRSAADEILASLDR
jgi:2-haloacid dehalogenase